jgi:hypothetical protein
MTASARMACRSAVISRASSSTRPAPINEVVCLSLENEGSILSNCALSKPSETKTLATSSPDPPSIGSLWQPKQEFESGPLVRLKGGLTPLLRLVGMIAYVALGRPAPSAVVNFALNKTRPRSVSAGRADGPAAATAVKTLLARKETTALDGFGHPAMVTQWQECANSGHPRTVWRTGQIDPFVPVWRRSGMSAQAVVLARRWNHGLCRAISSLQKFPGARLNLLQGGLGFRHGRRR